MLLKRLSEHLCRWIACINVLILAENIAGMFQFVFCVDATTLLIQKSFATSYLIPLQIIFTNKHCLLP